MVEVAVKVFFMPSRICCMVDSLSKNLVITAAPRVLDFCNPLKRAAYNQGERKYYLLPFLASCPSATNPL